MGRLGFYRATEREKMGDKFKIENIWAFCAEDEGGEGTPMFLQFDGTWHPLIGADEKRVMSYRPMAQKHADDHGVKVTLKKFSNFEVVEVIEPKK